MKFFVSMNLIYRDNTAAPSIDEVTTQEIDARVCEKFCFSCDYFSRN
jgi:hypothetical protein